MHVIKQDVILQGVWVQHACDQVGCYTAGGVVPRGVVFMQCVIRARGVEQASLYEISRVRLFLWQTNSIFIGLLDLLVLSMLASCIYWEKST